MEGDAGASRLNPPPMSMLRRLGKRAQRPSRGVPEESDATDDQTSTDTTDKAAEVKAEDSAESSAATEQTSTEVKAEDSAVRGCNRAGQERRKDPGSAGSQG